MPKRELQTLTREQRQRLAIDLDRRLDTIKQRLGRIRFRCYVCGLDSETYAGTPTVPPNPMEITTREQVVPIATCGRCRCARFEMMRQDALIQTILAPQREAYYQRRAEEREKEKKK